MTIESILERIAVALEAKASAPTANKPVATAKPVEAEAEPETEATAEEADTVGNVVSRLLKAQKRDEAVALLKKFGATSVSGVKKAKEAAFIAEGLEILLGA